MAGFTVYSGLSFAGLSAGCDTAEIEHRKKRIDGYYRDSSDVGKLCTAYYGLAVVVINAILGVLVLPGQDLANYNVAIVIGMVYDYLPFMILPVYNAVMELNEDVIEAARDLGAPLSAVLTKIMIPLTMPGIISGITMVFVPSLTTFAIPDILGGGKIMLIGNIIEQEFSTSMNWNLGSGLSIALMIFVLISMMFTVKNDGGKESSVW